MDDIMMEFNDKTILITGCAGFIGGALTERFLDSTTARIIGVDNLNDYYDVRLKEYRLQNIKKKDTMHRFCFIKDDVSDKNFVIKVFDRYMPTIVVHLAAQAGVRHSIEDPDVYIRSNIVGFYNLLEGCRYSVECQKNKKLHFVYASSSSVYGNNEKIPYSTKDRTDRPVSLYAATKKADELMAYAYSKLYDIQMTGMRFFTVYGPAGRPDMAYYKFADKLSAGKKIELFNYGNNMRDYTYIGDVVDAIEKIVISIPQTDRNGARHKIYNIGNNDPVDTITFLDHLVCALKEEGILSQGVDLKEYVSFVGSKPGDVEKTYADIEDLIKDFDIRPQVSLKEGLLSFAKWYKKYEM